MMTQPLLILMGVLLLISGRRLFWLFVGLAGFAAGLQSAPLFLGPQPVLVFWAAGLVCGIIGALLALFFQHLAIAVGGFMAGGLIAVHLAALLGFPPGGLIALAGGIAGAVALFMVFDWALIVLSALCGAALVAAGIAHGGGLHPLAFVLLSALGMAIQAGWLLATRRAKP